MIVRSGDKDFPLRRLYVHATPEIADQIKVASEGTANEIPVPLYRIAEYTHAFEYPRGVPDWLPSLLDQLERSLTPVVRPANLDLVLVLGRYKPTRSDQNTSIGARLSVAKYSPKDDRTRRSARVDVVAALSNAIEGHRLLASASHLVAVPGHTADGTSFGEWLVAEVARSTGKRLVETTDPGGMRLPAKERHADASPPTFKIEETLPGTSVVVVDDVYRSGTSMGAAARAARAAGAAKVFGLAVALVGK
ncbi:hypothetical protein ACQPYE_05525 [Actinosynnema sp. CA-299493]